MKHYLLQVLIAFDQLVCALIGGWADESLSSYAYRMWIKKKPFGFMKRVIDFIFFWDEDHCLKSYRAEQTRRQLPPALREPA